MRKSNCKIKKSLNDQVKKNPYFGNKLLPENMVIGNTKPKPVFQSRYLKSIQQNRDVRITTKKVKNKNNFENAPNPEVDNMKKSIDINEFQNVTLEQMRFSKNNPWDTITGSILEPSTMKGSV